MSTMTSSIFIVLCTLISFQSVAAEEAPQDHVQSVTGLLPKSSATGAYNGAHGALTGRRTVLLGQDAYLLGGRFGFSCYESVLFGLSGYKLSSQVREEETATEPKFEYDFISIGGYAGYNFFPKSLITFSLIQNIGWGIHGMKEANGDLGNTRRRESTLVLEPEALAEVHITDSFRLGFGYSRRYVRDPSFERLSNGDVNGTALILSLSLMENYAGGVSADRKLLSSL